MVMKALGLDMPVQDLVEKAAQPEAPWHPTLLAVFGTFVAPFTEEAVFRGMLYPVVRALGGGGRRGAWIGAVTISVVFAAIHASVFAFPLLFVLSMFLCWVFERTNSLLACYVCHALNNAGTLIPVLLRLYA
jgi:membrane protease YdiL (CAAX protease family)